jgi:hypothetical protein
MQEILLVRWPFESRPRQDKKLLPDWMDWLSNLADGSKMRFQFLAYRHGNHYQMVEILFTTVFHHSRNMVVLIRFFLTTAFL